MTVASFNDRSRALHRHVGFVEGDEFTSRGGLDFVIAELALDGRVPEVDCERR